MCMATHNGERYIKRQLDSILSQIGPTDEIVISDDGSTDRTKDIIYQYADKRIKFHQFSQPRNTLKPTLKGMLYASRNFENALKFAHGDIIILSDQDDIWYPEKVAVLTSLLQSFDIVKHNYSKIDGSDKVLKHMVYDSEKQTNRKIGHLLKYLPFRGCCMAFKKCVLDAAIPFPKVCLQHDTWIGMIAYLNDFKYFYTEEPLIYHRIHGENASELSEPNSMGYKVWYRFKLCLQLLKHIMGYSKNKHQ